MKLDEGPSEQIEEIDITKDITNKENQKHVTLLPAKSLQASTQHSTLLEQQI